MSTSLPPQSSPGDQASSDRSGSPVATDDLLPPVEPPSAKFIIQLFVTPMVIVAAVVGVWLLIQWLANSGDTDPDKIVSALRSSNQARFQQAAELTNMLQADGRYPGLKENRELVGKLADLLVEQVDAKREGEGDVTMRTILARWLGEFEIADGLPALIATAQRDEARDVRRYAVNAIAVLASNVPKLDTPELADLMDKLADSEDELLRSEAAFTIGELATQADANPEYQELLARLAEDFYPDANYNAALGLARVGDLRAMGVLIEMLDLDLLEASLASEKGVSEEDNPRQAALLKQHKRNVLIKNGLRGVELMLEKHEPSDLKPLEAAVQKLFDESAQLEEAQRVPDSLLEYAKKQRRKFE